LKSKAPAFVSSILNVANSSEALQRVAASNPQSIIRSAAVAAALDLPIDKNLGFAHIVPYKDEAQFQLGYKGYIQLAMRTGQYRTINACEIYEGEIVKQNRLTGELEFDEAQRTSDKIIGYAAYFKLSNGFEKTLYMTIEELREHGKKYSKSYFKDFSIWKQNESAMCLKTVLKLLLSKYGILSIEMQTALSTDQAIIKKDDLNDIDAIAHVDEPNFEGQTIDVEAAPSPETQVTE
jgi:recombination protein RecT